MFDEPRWIRASGRTLAAYAAGEGRPVVVLPGVWDLAASFRELVPPLVAAGHRVIAFDLPGHGRSPSWGETSISLASLSKVLADALAELGVERALVVGHDFGARLGRELAARHRGRVSALASIAMVLTGRMPVDPVALFREALGPRFFLLAIEAPGPVEALLRRDVERTLAFFHRGARPGSVPFEGTQYAFFDELDRFDPAAAPGYFLHDEPWRSRYVEAFEASGFDDALACLRPLTQNWRDEGDRPEGLDIPVAFILGELDALVPPSRLEGADLRPLFPNAVVEVVRGVGHHPHLEAPHDVVARLLELSRGASW